MCVCDCVCVCVSGAISKEVLLQLTGLSEQKGAMHCIFPAYTCIKQQKRDKHSRGLEGNTLSNVLCWEGSDRGLTIQRKRVNVPLLRERMPE